MDAALTTLCAALAGAGATAGGQALNARVSHKRIGAQNESDEANAHQARANAAKLIEEAAAGAIATIQAAADAAEQRLTARIEDLQTELAAARAELTAALASRAELTAEVERLTARVRELETKVGGRRDGDPSGPALAS